MTGPRFREAGYTLLELTVVLALVGILMGAAVSGWKAYGGRERIRHAAAQVATDLRQAQERARAERSEYRVVFTASSSGYVISRTMAGFTENTMLPQGVVPTANATIVFSPFGRPDANYAIGLQNAEGTATVSVNPMGGITYQLP